MGLAKTEKELREETRARRAKHDLKNTPLPLKHRISVLDPSKKRIFQDSYTSDSNKKALKGLMSQRMMNNLTHSRSMTDIHQCESLKRGNSLGRYSKSCQDLMDANNLRRSRSYSRILDQQNSLDQVVTTVHIQYYSTYTVLQYIYITTVPHYTATATAYIQYYIPTLYSYSIVI